MNSNDKNNNKINLDTSLCSHNEGLTNLVEKEKNYEGISKNYTLSVYNNFIENFDNLDINNNIITDNNNTLSKNLAKARKEKQMKMMKVLKNIEINQKMIKGKNILNLFKNI